MLCRLSLLFMWKVDKGDYNDDATLIRSLWMFSSEKRPFRISGKGVGETSPEIIFHLTIKSSNFHSINFKDSYCGYLDCV